MSDNEHYSETNHVAASVDDALLAIERLTLLTASGMLRSTSTASQKAEASSLLADVLRSMIIVADSEGISLERAVQRRLRELHLEFPPPDALWQTSTSSSSKYGSKAYNQAPAARQQSPSATTTTTASVVPVTATPAAAAAVRPPPVHISTASRSSSSSTIGSPPASFQQSRQTPRPLSHRSPEDVSWCSNSNAVQTSSCNNNYNSAVPTCSTSSPSYHSAAPLRQQLAAIAAAASNGMSAPPPPPMDPPYVTEYLDSLLFGPDAGHLLPDDTEDPVSADFFHPVTATMTNNSIIAISPMTPAVDTMHQSLHDGAALSLTSARRSFRDRLGVSSRQSSHETIEVSGVMMMSATNSGSGGMSAPPPLMLQHPQALQQRPHALYHVETGFGSGSARTPSAVSSRGTSKSMDSNVGELFSLDCVKVQTSSDTKASTTDDEYPLLRTAFENHHVMETQGKNVKRVFPEPPQPPPALHDLQGSIAPRGDDVSPAEHSSSKMVVSSPSSAEVVVVVSASKTDGNATADQHHRRTVAVAPPTRVLFGLELLRQARDEVMMSRVGR